MAVVPLQYCEGLLPRALKTILLWPSLAATTLILATQAKAEDNNLESAEKEHDALSLAAPFEGQNPAVLWTETSAVAASGTGLTTSLLVEPNHLSLASAIGADSTAKILPASSILPVAMPMGAPAIPAMTDSFNAKLVVSQFTTIPVAGDVPNTFRYSGRADAYFDVGGSLFGLDDSFTLSVRPELTWGQNTNGEIGLIPTDTAAFRPGGKGEFDVSINIRKRWSSGVSLTLGKVNALDIAGSLPIVGSDGHYGFQNLGVALPPTAIIPNTLTAAMLEVPTEGWLFRAWVFDPDSQFERTGFETAFENGVAGLVAATKITRIGRNPGFYSVGVAASTRSSPNTELLPLPLPPGGAFGDEENEIALSLSAYQFVQVYPEAPGKGWGLLGRFQVSDGDPTFLDWSVYFGLAGNPKFRPQDRFGVAWFRYSITDELVDDVAFFLQLEDEEGVEGFYTFEFAKGFQLTANAQVVNGGVATADTGVILGMRLTAGF
jgi:porin